jgi:hypothetical protein
LFTGALHFLDVKEPLGKLAAGELAEGLIQIQRGLKLAGIRCEFHNAFWPLADSILCWFFKAECKVKATKQALPGKPAVVPQRDRLTGCHCWLVQQCLVALTLRHVRRETSPS